MLKIGHFLLYLMNCFMFSTCVNVKITSYIIKQKKGIVSGLNMDKYKYIIMVLFFENILLSVYIISIYTEYTTMSNYRSKYTCYENNLQALSISREIEKVDTQLFEA